MRSVTSVWQTKGGTQLSGWKTIRQKLQSLILLLLLMLRQRNLRRSTEWTAPVRLGWFGVSERCRTVMLQMARTARRPVRPALSKQFVFSPSARIYLALQFMWSALPPACVGFQPGLGGVLSNRNGSRVEADLGLVVPCKSHPPYLTAAVAHVMIDKWLAGCVWWCVCVFPKQFKWNWDLQDCGLWFKPYMSRTSPSLEPFLQMSNLFEIINFDMAADMSRIRFLETLSKGSDTHYDSIVLIQTSGLTGQCVVLQGLLSFPLIKSPIFQCLTFMVFNHL